MSSFETAARWVGNLNHPHYADERQRHVWYEASAVASQSLMTSILAVAAAAVWIGGTTALPYTVAFLGCLFLNVGLFQWYVTHYGAGYAAQGADFRSLRVLISLGLAVVYFAGVARAIEIGVWPVVGFAASLLAVAGIAARRSK